MLSIRMCLKKLYIHNNTCFFGNADSLKNFLNIRKKNVKFYKKIIRNFSYYTTSNSTSVHSLHTITEVINNKKSELTIN